MATNILKAEVATVKIGYIEFEGLLLEDDSFAIAQQQIASIFSVIPTSAPKWLKTNLGEHLQLFKVRTNRAKQAGKQNRAENAIDLITFERLLKKLDRKGNPVAQDINDLLIGGMLNQLFSDSFGIKFETEERQKFLKQRQAGKADRRSLTDAMKAWGETTGNTPEYAIVSANTYKALFGMSKKELCESRNITYTDATTPRDYLNYDELTKLSRFEDYAARVIENDGLKPLSAVKAAKNFYC